MIRLSPHRQSHRVWGWASSPKRQASMHLSALRGLAWVLGYGASLLQKWISCSASSLCNTKVLISFVTPRLTGLLIYPDWYMSAKYQCERELLKTKFMVDLSWGNNTLAWPLIYLLEPALGVCYRHRIVFRHRRLLPCIPLCLCAVTFMEFI